MATYYETLGLDPSASLADIERVYRFLAQKFHPDANPANPQMARQRFQSIQAAYETLSDPGKRREYDAKLGAGLGPDWEPITMNTDNGGVRFNSDGSLNVAGQHIQAVEAIPRKSLGSATIEKDAGSGGEFRVWHNGKFHRFRFANRAWHTRRDKSAQQAPRPSTNKTSRDLAPAMPGTRQTTHSAPDILLKRQGRPMRTLVFGCILLAVGLLGGFFASRSGSRDLALTAEEQIQQKEQELKQREQLATLDAKLQEQSALEEGNRQAQALIREQLLAAKRTGEGALAKVAALSTELQLWEEQISPLLSNQEGRKIATSEQSLRVFKSLYEKRRVSSAEATALRVEIEALLTPITAALTAPTPADSASQQITERLQAKQAEIEVAAAELRQRRESIRNLLSLSKGIDATTKTLEAALADLALTDMQGEAELISETEKETRQAAALELAAARKKLMEAEAEQERLAIENQADALVSQVEHERNLKEAQTKQVKNMLHYFITPGYYQPDSMRYYQKTIEPHPFSYAKLRAQGALEPTSKGMEALLFIATAYPDDLRPKWNMSRHLQQLTPDQTKQLAETQELLRRLGDALVELKMLDP